MFWALEPPTEDPSKRAQLREAENVWWQVYALRERLLGHEHRDTITALSNIGLIT